MSAPARIEVGRLEANYLVPSDPSPTLDLVHRLDQAARRLAPPLGQLLAALETESPGAIWLIRRIELDLGLDAAGDPDRIATRWATALAGAIVRKLDRNAEGVVTFATGTTYLAHFLAELAADRAWSSWYFHAFAGLRSLPVPAALRTAILADSAQGLQALLLLERPERARVLGQLSAREAARVLDGLTESVGADLLPGSTLLVGALESVELSTLCAERLALHFFLALARLSPGQLGRGTATAARALSSLRMAAAQGATAVFAPIVSGSLTELYRATEPATAERLALLLKLARPVRTSLVAAAREGPARGITGARDTSFGGFFLLLRDLETVPVHEAESWPPAARIEAPHLLRFLVLATCAGPDRALAAFLDPLWRDLFALPGPFGVGELATWAGSLHTSSVRRWKRSLPKVAGRRRTERSWPILPPVLEGALACAAGHLLTRFAARLPGFASSSPPHLRRNFLEVHARVVLDEAAVEVELARPPLDVILQMSGAHRTRLDLPWLDARSFDLRPEP
jgi:hypothetical protein